MATAEQLVLPNNLFKCSTFPAPPEAIIGVLETLEAILYKL